MTSTNWHETTFGELIEIKHGFAFKGEFFGEAGEHIVLTPGNFHEHGGMKLKGEKEKFYTDVPPDEYVMNRGDLIVAMTDLVQNAPILGSSAFVPESGKFLHNQRLGKITVKRPDLVSPEFTFWLFNSYSVRGQIKGSATGSTVRHTSPSRIYEVRVELPPLPTQRKIASILSAYDDLIENNTRRIAILEEMAQAIYREWFVNFRFPGHENVKLVDSPLGQIPEGWEAVTTRDAIEIKPRTHVPKEGEKHFVSMGAVPHNTMLIDDSEIEFRTKNSGSKFRNGDTLFARITPCLENGKTAFVNFLPSDEHVACGSTEFIVLRSKTVIPEFVYLLARSDEFRDIAIKSMSGATGRQRVREACFDQFYFAHPTPTLLEQFQEVATPLFRGVFTLAKKNHNLRTTRDLLLPKLISGKLDVEELDIDVGMTAEALEEATA